MPEFMDIHRGMEGITPEGLADAHQADLAIQDEEQVNFKHAWADPETGLVWCLSEAQQGGRHEDPRAGRAPDRRGVSGSGPGVVRPEHPPKGGP